MDEKSPQKWLLEQKKNGSTSCFIIGALDDHSSLKNFAYYNHVVWFIQQENLPPDPTIYDNVYPMTLDSIDEPKLDEIINTLCQENLVCTPDIYCSPDILENCSNAYDLILQRIQLFLEEKIRGVNTQRIHGFKSQKNVLRNIPHLLSNRLSDSSRNSLKNIPAAIIGAGPSIDEGIEVIKKFHSNFLIFCTDSAVRILNEINIEPDAIITVDASKEPDQILDSKKEIKSVFVSLKSPLTWVEKVDSNVHYISGTNLADEWLKQNGFPITGARIVGNCGITALNLSIFFGCNPIMLFGMDHAASDDGKRWSSAHSERESSVKDILTTVEGNYSPSVKTHVAGELNAASSIVSELPPNQKVWNVTDRGAKIKGAKVIHPKDFDLKEKIITKEKSFDFKSKNLNKKELKELFNKIKSTLQKNKSIIRNLKKFGKNDLENVHVSLAKLFKDDNIFKLCGNFTLKITPLLVLWSQLEDSEKQNILDESIVMLEELKNLQLSLITLFK